MPQWLLRAWCAPSDSLLQSFRRLPNFQLISQRKSTKSVAIKRDLYRWVSQTQQDPNELEKTFFQELDNNAARAVEILREPGTRPMPMDMRKHWARFLSATVARTPGAIEGWRLHVWGQAHERIGFDIAFVEELQPGWVADTGLEQVISFISGDQSVDMWMDLQWFVERTDGATYDLLTSDCPGIGRCIDESCHRRIFLYPIAPRRLFCATNDPLMEYLISAGPRDFCVNWSNNLQIRHARRYLFATDDSLKWHIEKFFGEGFPDPPLPDISSK